MAKAGTKKDRLVSIDQLETIDISWTNDGEETAEQLYSRVVPKERRSSLGQFFTPAPISDLMARWISVNRPRTILEPSVGTGILARSARSLLKESEIICVDIDASPLNVARSTMEDDGLAHFIKNDFLVTDIPSVDAILANPPYLRHQNLNYEIDIHAEIGNRNGVKISRLANLYVLFIFEICRLLKTGGRAAIIVPAEWMNANYGSSLKEYFYKTGYLRKLIYFSHDTLAFEDALTTAAILFIEKNEVNREKEPLDVLYVQDKVEINCLGQLLFGETKECAGVTRQLVTWDTLLSAQKWDRLFAMGAHEGKDHLVTVQELCKSRRGIATGANDFFHLRPSQVREFGISEANTKVCIGRAMDVKGLMFTESDLVRLDEQDERTRLISFGSSLTSNDLAYIAKGKSEQLHERYLLASRSPWYSMENREPAAIWAAVFGRDNLRFVCNRANASNLTTFHCLYPIGLTELQITALVGLLNSTPVQELAMRHRRVYGGGLSKFEPKDLLLLEVPDVRIIPSDILLQIANLTCEWDGQLRKDPSYSPDELNALAAQLINEPFVAITERAQGSFEQAELF